jgi:DNA-binding GntR family transcriptional regulator
MPLPVTDGISVRQNAREAVYARLRDWILRGPLEPGEIIRDADIAQVLGVSRTPVREALLRLEGDGLVETAPARWTRVAPLRLDQAANLYELGGVLDAYAAEKATLRLAADDLRRMQRAIDRLFETSDPIELQDADDAFHAVYYTAADNPFVISVLDNTLFEVRRLERINFRDPATAEVAYREHMAILDAFRARDAQAAAAAARFNWLHAWPRIQQILAEAAPAGAATSVSGSAGAGNGRSDASARQRARIDRTKGASLD